LAAPQHSLRDRRRQLGARLAGRGRPAYQDAHGRAEEIEPALVLALHALRGADHDDLVVTEAGGEALWPNWPDRSCAWPTSPEVVALAEPLPLVVCALLVPAPSAGSWPAAIWIASPPAIAPDAISDAPSSLSVILLVEGSSSAGCQL
jgi:hypothetical protein